MKASSPRQNKAVVEFKPQLSGLRFCAVAFVVVYHYSSMLESFRTVYDLGNIIVFFFVLSSYLITKILLKSKRKAIEKDVRKYKVGLNFLLRRTFRIFPAYYFYLFIMICLPVVGLEVRQYAQMYFLYLSNFLIYIQRSFGPYTAHLWTLAVEEQFYIIWPWIILLIPERFLPEVFGLLIGIAVVFRICFSWFLHAGGFEMWVLTPACADSFALGGLLAYYHFRGKKTRNWVIAAVLVVMPFWIFLVFTNHQRSFVGLNRVFLSLASIAIIDKADRGFGGFVGKMLENSVVQYLAKISYGIYLYHLIASLFYWKFFDFVTAHLKTRGINLEGLRRVTSSPWISFWIYAAIAVGSATLSWYLLEQPVNNLKRFVAYVVPHKKEAATVVRRD